MSHITWLHLSHLHFHTDKSPNAILEAYNREVVLSSLLGDLQNYPQEHNLSVDFIIITGDIAFSGRGDEYELAAAFLDKVLEIFHRPKNRLFIVPGNHDVDRHKIDPCLKPTLDDRDDRNGFLSNKEVKETCFKKFEAYRDFLNKYFGGDLEFDYDQRYFWTKRFSLKGTEIGLLGLNSAWNSSEAGGTDRNQLLIGEKQVRDALAKVDGADLSIAAFHHPLDWLQDDDRSDIERELGRKCQFVLHGHMHKPGIRFDITPDRSWIVIPGGCCYEKRPYSNSYNYLTINRNTNQVTLHLRRYSDALCRWQADTQTFANISNGICSFDLAQTSPFISLAPKPKSIPPSQVALPNLPLKPYFAHSRPIEKYWAGRKTELAQLTEWYQDEAVKAIGLIGFGGGGKSAMARKWLDEIRPDGVFWWCFYHEPSQDAFLLEALKYLSNRQFRLQDAPSSPARVRALLDYLVRGRFILVLDGLEEMQAAEDTREHFGEMKELTFADLLGGWAEREHHSLLLITTRYTVKDLQPYEGQSYRRLFVECLSLEDARELMRKRRVVGSDKELDKVASDYNYHALSLKLIASYLNAYFKGDVACVSQIPFLAMETDKKIAKILAAYDGKLDAARRVFMAIFSTFRRLVEEDALDTVFRRNISGFDNSTLVSLSPFDFQQRLKYLVNLGLISQDSGPQGNTYSTHPLIHHYYYEHLRDNARISIQQQVAKYYEEKAHPNPQTLEDLTAALEAFHHTIQTHAYEQAYSIYNQKINVGRGAGSNLVTNMGAFELDLSLVSQLFTGGDTSQESLVAAARDKAHLISTVGFCLMFLGQLAKAVPFYERSIQMDLANNNWNGASIGSQNLCLIKLNLGNLAEAEKVASDALNHAQKGKHEGWESNSRAYLAYAAFLKGRNLEAKQLFEQANKLVQRSRGTKYLHALCGIWYAEFLARQEKRVLAEEVTQENLKICQKNDWRYIIVDCYRLLAGLALDCLDYSKAKFYLSIGFEKARNISLQEEIAKLHLSYARLYLAQNDLSHADRALKEALAICTRCSYKLIEIDTHNVLAQVYRAASQSTLAHQEAQTAMDMSLQCGYHWGKTGAKKILSKLER